MLAFAGVARADVEFGPNDVPTVFFIDKSDDLNRVDYGVRLDADCHPISGSAMVVYWRVFEGDREGRRTLGLNIFEGPVYGIGRQVLVAHDDEEAVLEIEVRALPGRRIRIRSRREAGRCVAEGHATIAGSEARLRSVHVTLGDGPGAVRFLDVFGTREDGTSVRERIER